MLFLGEGRPSPTIEGTQPLALPYCDNLNVIGTDPRVVLEQRIVIQKAFEKLGFEMHEETEALSVCQIFGAELDGWRGVLVLIVKRRFRLQQALRWLARRPCITGRELE